MWTNSCSTHSRTLFTCSMHTQTQNWITHTEKRTHRKAFRYEPNKNLWCQWSDKECHLFKIPQSQLKYFPTIENIKLIFEFYQYQWPWWNDELFLNVWRVHFVWCAKCVSMLLSNSECVSVLVCATLDLHPVAVILLWWGREQRDQTFNSWLGLPVPIPQMCATHPREGLEGERASVSPKPFLHVVLVI